ncbi:hypothetical protein BH23ACT3_BH23ACT3_10150 [soil metagenome]
MNPEVLYWPRSGVKVVVAAAAAIAMLVGPLVSPLVSLPGAPSAATAVAAEPPVLVLVDQNFVVLADGVLQMRYEVHGNLDVPPVAEPPAGAPGTDAGDDGNDDTGTDAGADGTDTVDTSDRIDVLVTSYAPIANRDRVASVLAGATGPAIDGARFDLSDVFVPATISDSAHFDLDVVTSTGGEIASELELPLPGLYPITVELRRDGRRLARHITFVERLAANGQRPRRTEPYGLAIVATVPDPGPEPTRLELVDARSRLVEIAQLGEDLDVPVTVGIPPVVAAELEADEELTARMQRALKGSEIMAAPRIQFDPSSAVSAGASEAFTRELRAGEDILARTFPSTAVRRTAWRWDDAISNDGAALLRDLGVQMVVMSLDDYHGLGNALPPEFTDPSLLYTVVLPDGATLAVIAVDPVSGLLDSDRFDLRSAADRAVEIFATLVASRLQLPDAPRSVVLSTDGLGIPDTDVLSVIESFAADHPAFRFQTLSLLPNSTGVMFVDGPRRDVEFPASAGVDLAARTDRVGLTRILVDSLSSMLPDDDPRPGQWHAQLDLVLSTWFSEPVAEARVDSVIRDVETVPSVIVPPDPFTFTLTGSTSEITLRIGNDGDVPIRVRIRTEATKLRFPEGDADAVLQPGITNLVIPVTVLSNGTFPVTIELLTPLDNRPVGDSVVLTARVNAITGLGQVLTGGALLVLGSWWYSHFRNRRRHRTTRARTNHPTSRPSPTARNHDTGHDTGHNTGHNTGHEFSDDARDGHGRPDSVVQP